MTTENFATVYEQNQKRIYNLCLGMVKNPALAEDMAQETFLKALKGCEAFRGESNVTTWLHTIALNTCRMHFRATKCRPTDSINEQVDGEEETVPMDIAVRDLALSGVVDRMAISQAMATVPEGARMILAMHLDGYDNSEIAASLRISTGGTASQLCRAKSKLRASLKAVSA